jgi:outer membrane lipoprotein-sorting protein
MKKSLSYVLLATSLLMQPAAAETSLKQLQNYMNGFKTLQGDFEQQSSNGDVVRGQFAIQKPGKIRLDYASPSSQVIFSNDGVLYIYDRTSRDVAQMDLSQSMAEVLLRSNIEFESEGVRIKKFEEEGNTVELTLQKVGSEDAGEITLVFQRKPLQLIQWVVVDAQNQQTVVDVNNLRRNQSFELMTDPNQIIGN